MSRSFVVVQLCEGKGSCVDVSIHELCFHRPMSRSFVVVQLCEGKGSCVDPGLKHPHNYLSLHTTEQQQKT
jgi:hypothetical protein